MKVLAAYGRDNLATIWIAELGSGRVVECVESTQPPFTMDQKWVLIVSVSAGCPVRCLMCDAGGHFEGHLSAAEMLEQIDFIVLRRCPDRVIGAPKFKIQFARMGEPAYNMSVLSLLRELPGRYQAPGLVPCISTIAPQGADRFFEALIDIKNDHYRAGNFQMQFSIHTTDQNLRDGLMPVRKWSFREIADYGRRFYVAGDKKLTLNFATPRNYPVDPSVVRDYFDPRLFLLKFTPVNPTFQAVNAGLKSFIDAYRNDSVYEELDNLRQHGYDVLVSIGENEENLIGSNCGQYVRAFLSAGAEIENSYRLDDYRLERQGRSQAQRSIP